jgi:tetratricopeptide (TPR) repeat protein
MTDSLEYIDNYFQGKFLPEEKKLFEQRIAEDPAFAEEVAFYLSARQVGKEHLAEEKKKRFKELYEQNNLSGANKTPARKFWPWLAAAAVIAGIVFGLVLFMKPSSPQQLADQYIHQNLQTLHVSMGSGGDKLQTGLQLYNQGELTDALQQFEKIIRSDSVNADAKKYAGIVYLRQQQYDKALEYFQQLEKNTSLYANPSFFYHALTLMKRNQPGDKQEAKRLLNKVVQENRDEKESARQWLKKL